MNTFDQAIDLVAKLSDGEKAQLLQVVAGQLGDAHLGIESRSEVCGGEPCVVRTRIHVWVLEQSRRLGASEADLLSSYPTLRAGDLANAWAYVRQHSHEVDEQISANENG